jgi:large subunit ribosomal protein L18
MHRHHRDIARVRRKKRVRKKILGTDSRPRLCIFRSHKHIYAQVISDDEGKTLLSVSTLSGEMGDKTKKRKGVEVAKQVGLSLARICKEKNITRLVFDRNGFLFHGRVKAVADGAREGGLEL